MASAICDIALALGVTLGGNCQPADVTPEPMPQDDPAAWAFKMPEPKKEEPKPAPNFGPIIIKQEVIREVPAPAPPPVPVPAPSPKADRPKQPDPVELAARAAYASRAQGGWQSISVPVSLPKTGTAASLDARAAVPKMPARPLDLAAVVRSQGDEEYQEKERLSTLPVDNSRLIATDRWIPVIAENGINTQLDGSSGGTGILQVSDNVFGYHGRNILIPKGSRIVCGYKPLDNVGSSRAPLRCGRILMGGHRAEIYAMKANAMDMQGKLGVSGDVDNRFWERYGTAFILTGISTAVRIATTSKTTNESLAAQSNALDTGGEELAQRLGEITAETLKQTLPLNPILNVAQGTRLQILPDTDWYIADPNNPRKPRVAKE